MKIKIARILALASKAVYLNPDEVKNLAADWGFNDFSWHEVSDTQACVMISEAQCILVFRGTESVQDWLTDLDVFQEPGPYGNVHSGFQKALNYVWDEIKSRLVNLKPLYVCGHSLGGSLATLAVARGGIGRLYTFGSPKVGDPKFAREFDRRHRSYRFVNNNDFFVRIPIQNYQHIGSLRYFTSNGKMWAEPPNWWVTYDRIIGRFRRKAIDGIRDHSIDSYISLIEKQI